MNQSKKKCSVATCASTSARQMSKKKPIKLFT